MNLASSFINNIQSTYGECGKVWLKHLPDHLASLAAQYNFELLYPIPELSYNYVAVVRLSSGLAILKTAPPRARLMAEAAWLKSHKKSVPLIFVSDKEKNAVLMEKIEPGQSLKSVITEENDEKATEILAQVILNLQSMDPLHQADYPHISEHISALSYLRGHLEEKILSHAKSLFTELCIDRAHDIVLHGDLHHDNILQSHTEWKVIDPHGYLGDPCAEIGPLFFNPVDCFPHSASLEKITVRRIEILSNLLPFDKNRLKAWAFCLALRSAAWDVEGFGEPNLQTLAIGKALYLML